MSYVICVDGPAASGKSTVGRLVSNKLGCLYVDSGALYRIVTWRALMSGIDTDDAGAVASFASAICPVFRIRDNRVVCETNGEEPGDKIRTPEINRHVSPVSAVPEVREIVTGWLRNMRNLGDLIVEGRDIGSVVFPDSPFRFYLDADPEERSRRRYTEEVKKGISNDFSKEEVKKSILNRDKIDSTRKTSPLKIPDGAVFIDTTPMSAEEVANVIVREVQLRMARC